MDKRIFLILPFFFIFLISYAQQGMPISSCVDITEPGYYYLTGNIYKGDDGHCIFINASDVILFCNDYEIYSSYNPYQQSGPNSYGIVVSRASNVEIHNCKLHNFVVALVVDNSNDVSIFDSEISYNYIGIGSAGACNGIYLYANEIHHNYQAGALFSNANNVYITLVSTIGPPLRNFFHDNVGYSVIFENSNFLVLGNLFLDMVPLRIINSNGYVVDNGFTGNFAYFNYISGNVRFYIDPITDGCNFNYLLGCGRGGNYYSTYSINCRNDDKNSFCDSGYSIPIVPSGPTIIDNYPLAYPQPYLKEPQVPSSVYVRVGESVNIDISVSWNYIINGIGTSCSIGQPLSCVYVGNNCDLNQQDGSCTITYRVVVPSNAQIGGYRATLIINQGDCQYVKYVDVNVYSEACSGSVVLSLNPNRVKKGNSFTASISGLSNCGGTAYFKFFGCDGYTIGSCSVSGSGCSASISTENIGAGNYQVYGCFDINGDGSYSSGEYDVKSLEIYEETLPQLPNEVKECGEIRSSGYYRLIDDVYSNMTSCIKVSANNVILDCNNRIISPGTERDTGILVNGNNVQIMNCIVNGFNNGIKVSGANSVDIMYSKLVGNSVGVRVENGASNVNVYSTDFSNNDYGIYGISSSNIFTSCERGKLYEKRDVINEFLGSTTNSIYLKNVNFFIISCSEFNDRIPLHIENSNGYVYDNSFVGSFEKVNVVNSDVKFNYIYKVQNIAGTNILLGCGGGGNYYINYTNCRNRDLDSFCDDRLKVPGTNIYDNLPLAYPQPYLKWPGYWPLLHRVNESIEIEVGGTQVIRIPLEWNYKIKDVSTSCNTLDPIGCKIEKKGCDFSQENGSCYLDVILNVPEEPPNVNYTGIYPINVSLITGDCKYLLYGNITVYKVVYPPLYPEIPFLSIPFIALSLIFGFGLAMEVEANRRGANSKGAILITFLVIGVIALVLLKLIPSFILAILVIIGAVMFALIFSKIFGG